MKTTSKKTTYVPKRLRICTLRTRMGWKWFLVDVFNCTVKEGIVYNGTKSDARNEARRYRALLTA